MTACIVKKVVLGSAPMRVVGGELVVLRINAAPSSNGRGATTPAGENV